MGLAKKEREQRTAPPTGRRNAVLNVALAPSAGMENQSKTFVDIHLKKYILNGIK